MPKSAPLAHPRETRLLRQFGERLRLARRRRRFTAAIVAERAGCSRTTLWNVERGDASVTLGTYLRVLSVLGLEADLEALAADDELGRMLQDAALPRRGTST
jgi:transcriptional regulator with XRE-family HTH domain